MIQDGLPDHDHTDDLPRLGHTDAESSEMLGGTLLRRDRPLKVLRVELHPAPKDVTEQATLTSQLEPPLSRPFQQICVVTDQDEGYRENL